MPKFIALLFLLAVARLCAADYPEPTGRAFARTFPYSMVGQIEFDNGPYSYSGSGTVIKPNSVLTAGHVMWDPDYGWSTHMLFSRSLYHNSDLSEQFARRKYLLAGYSRGAYYYGPDSLPAFANDMGAMRFTTSPADGAFIGVRASLADLTNRASHQLLGYGAEIHSGDELLAVTTTAGFSLTRGGFYENDTIAAEAGMSGGPVVTLGMDGALHVTGILVAGSDQPVSAGIRVIDSKALRFIDVYLR